MFKNRSISSLPISNWLTFEDAAVGLLLSSFAINLLGLVFPICLLQFYDRVIPNRSIGTLAVLVMLILGALAFEVILKILRAYVSSWASARFTFNVGKKLFDKLLRLDLVKFQENTAGVYLDKYNSAESLRDHYCGQNLIMLVDLPFIFVYLGLMLFISKYLALVPVIVMIMMIFSAVSAGNKEFENLATKMRMSEIKSKFLIEMISGIHTIKSMGMEEQFMRRYERLHEREITNNYDLIQRTSESSRTGNLYSQLAIILTVCVGSILVIKHSITVGGLAASILLVGKLMLPVSKLVMYIEKGKNLDLARADLDYILTLKPEYKKGLRVIEGLQGAIELRGVAFKYPNTNVYTIKEANVKIEPNETVVIHGTGFSGKTTILMLIDSLYKPTEGDVYVDGMNLNELDLESYRRHVAFMSDGGELFGGTILENMTMMEPDKYAEKAKEIAKKLGLHDIIQAMPNSYATEVGTGTVDLLSRGHKQMILIIRTLLDDPQIILFDEANMSLDIDSDIKLRKYLQSLRGKRTLILVTHRPSLLEIANRHFKIEEGKLVEFKWK